MKAALSQMERVGSKFGKATLLKVSVLPDNIEIAKQGMTRIVKAQTDGLADIMVPAILLKSYLSTTPAGAITFTFTRGAVQCGSSKFSSPAITVETVFNMPENELPINATQMSLFRFSAFKTEEEINRLGMSSSIKKARSMLFKKIEKAAELLKDYEVTVEDLNHLIDGKINK